MNRQLANVGVVVAMLVLPAAAAGAQAQTAARVLDWSGRTLSVAPPATGSREAVITVLVPDRKVTPEPAAVCGSTIPDWETLTLSYRIQASPQASPGDWNHLEPVPIKPETTLKLPLQTGGFTLYELRKSIASAPASKDVWMGCVTKLAALLGSSNQKDAGARLAGAKKDAELKVKEFAAILDRLQKEIDELRTSGSNLAARQLMVDQEQREKVRLDAELVQACMKDPDACDAKRARTSDGDALVVKLHDAYASSAEARQAVWAQIGCAKDGHKCVDQEPVSYMLALREALQGKIAATGVLMGGRGRTGAGTEALYYDFAAWKPEAQSAPPNLGSKPVTFYQDSMYVVLANVTYEKDRRPFTVSVSSQAGPAVNTAPARPVFDLGAAVPTIAAEALPQLEPLEQLHYFTDVLIPVDADFAPNDVPVVTVSALVDDEKEKGKFKTAKVLDGEKLPQLRARYRYNFTAGVFWSNLRDQTFVKVKTQADDPTTSDVSEARYGIQTVEEKAGFKPAAALSFYLVPVDIRGGVGWARLPAPTIGFALNGPIDNVYLGLTSEVVRNTQLFVGWHFGKVNALVARNTVDEEKDATAPATRRTWSSGKFAVGFSFNLRIIEKIFK